MSLIFGILVDEVIDSPRVQRTAEGTEITHSFHVGTSSPEWIISFLIPYDGLYWVHNAPHPTLPFLYVDRLSIEPDKRGIGKCKVHVTYKEWPLGVTPNDETWEWDIAARQETIGSVRDSSYQVHWPAAADTGTVIGANGEKTEGASVYRPATSMIVTKTWPYIDPNGRLLLESMRGTVNTGYWVDYAPGEVLFTGAKIRRRSDGRIVVEYNFLISRWQGTQTVQLYDDSTVEMTPAPWDYVWFKYINQPNTSDGVTRVKRDIESIHIAQVYEYANFNLFGLVGPYG